MVKLLPVENLRQIHLMNVHRVIKYFPCKIKLNVCHICWVNCLRNKLKSVWFVDIFIVVVVTLGKELSVN